MSLRFRVASGKCAIWDGATDTAPFDDPLSHCDRLKFHSDLYYPTVIDQRDVTVSFPAVGSNGRRDVAHTLFAHGQPGTPWVRGRATVGGVSQPLAGHIPIQYSVYDSSSFGQYGVWPRWIALGVNATNVILYEYAHAAQGQSLPAITLTVTVYVLSEILE